MTLTLLRQGSPLATGLAQLQILNGTQESAGPQFDHVLKDHRIEPLRASSLQSLQINLGKLCNQTCSHCHVDAGPDRREIMTRETAEACLDVLRRHDIPLVDLTGGAPEMNPQFRWMVEECRKLDRRVIDRCNLTILTAPGFDDLPEFLAANQVEVVASLPCYLEENTDRQRGDGVFQRSIQALLRLNALGYGQPDGRLPLTLVFNPVGPALPPPQKSLEEAYRQQLFERYGIVFTRLITITNLPVSRFLDELVQTDRYEEYMAQLVAAFNPAAADGVMCRTTLSVDWQGRLFDCDFNQMLDLPVAAGDVVNIRDFTPDRLENRRIMTGRHCFGCTAGAGSSCQGQIVPS